MCEQSWYRTEWILLELQNTKTRHSLSILDGKMSKFNTHKNEKYLLKVHIFNVWKIIMQSLNKKEWILLELQITQTRHPLSILDGKNV